MNIKPNVLRFCRNELPFDLKFVITCDFAYNKLNFIAIYNCAQGRWNKKRTRAANVCSRAPTNFNHLPPPPPHSSSGAPDCACPGANWIQRSVNRILSLFLPFRISIEKEKCRFP